MCSHSACLTIDGDMSEYGVNNNISLFRLHPHAHNNNKNKNNNNRRSHAAQTCQQL
jgi:hypothetical protein